jgi:hypothetical protein
MQHNILQLTNYRKYKQKHSPHINTEILLTKSKLFE